MEQCWQAAFHLLSQKITVCSGVGQQLLFIQCLAHNPESAELDAALTEYAELREQAQGLDPIQLYEIRPCKKQEAENRAQQVYGEKYSPLLMFDSKKAVSRMLHEDIERQAIRRMVRQAQKEQQTFRKEKAKIGDHGEC